MCLFPRAIMDSSSPAFLAGLKYFECGGCPECLSKRSSRHVLTSVFEAKKHVHNCMVTLTYDRYIRDNCGRIIGEEEPNRDLHVCKRDIQLFIKRLRKKFGPGIRYRVSAEYGKRTHRAHYHVLLFGVQFPDVVRYKRSKRGNWIYHSHLLSKLWCHGICTVDCLHVEGKLARYCSKYASKDARGDSDTFMLQSHHLGLEALLEAFNGRSYIVEGREYPIPRNVWERVISDRYKDLPYVFSYKYVNHPDWTLVGRPNHVCHGSIDFEDMESSLDYSIACSSDVLHPFLISRELRRRYRLIRDCDPQYQAYLKYWKRKSWKFEEFKFDELSRILALPDDKYYIYKQRALAAYHKRLRCEPYDIPRSNARWNTGYLKYGHFARLAFVPNRVVHLPYPSCHNTANDTISPKLVRINYKGSYFKRSFYYKPGVQMSFFDRE